MGRRILLKEVINWSGGLEHVLSFHNPISLFFQRGRYTTNQEKHGEERHK